MGANTEPQAADDLRQALGEALASKLADMCEEGQAPDWFDAAHVDELLDVLMPVLLASQDHQDAEAYRRINTPEIVDFLAAVQNEALHQRERWGVENDAGKTDADWFWLVGYLAGKALRTDATQEKQLHHLVATAGALLNWHSARIGAYAAMRPGIDPAAHGITDAVDSDGGQ